MEKRFYVDTDSFQDSLFLTDSEFHHLARVMRMRPGDEVELVNGRGLLARARIEEIKKEGAQLAIFNCIEEPPPSPSLLLGIALFRLNRLEWTIEKGTELGASGFYLFAADRSEQEKLSYHQLLRLKHLSIAAMKQCGRLYLPEITVCASLKDLFHLDAQILYGDPQAAQKEKKELSSNILFLTGPEGGFSEDELAHLEERRAQPIRLHENVLRAETAPLAALCYLIYHNL